MQAKGFHELNETPSRIDPRGGCGRWVAGATALPALCEGVLQSRTREGCVRLRCSCIFCLYFFPLCLPAENER